EEFLDVFWREIGDDAIYGNVGVDCTKFLLGGNGFWQRAVGVGFVEESLALPVRGLDKIAVEDAQTSDACAGEQSSGGGADSSTADNNGRGRGEALLAGFAYTRKENLAGVTVEGCRVFGK